MSDASALLRLPMASKRRVVAVTEGLAACSGFLSCSTLVDIDENPKREGHRPSPYEKPF